MNDSKHARRADDRPHKCTVPHWDSKGFSSLSDLTRHINTVHTSHNIFCPVAECRRSETGSVKKTFKRKDHLSEHMRRKHLYNPSLLTPSLSRSPSPQQHVPESPPYLERTVLLSAGNSKGKQRSSEDGEEHGQPTKRRDFAKEVEVLKAENMGLKESRDFERARVKWLEDNNKILTQFIDRLPKDKT